MNHTELARTLISLTLSIITLAAILIFILIGAIILTKFTFKKQTTSYNSDNEIVQTWIVQTCVDVGIAITCQWNETCKILNISTLRNPNLLDDEKMKLLNKRIQELQNKLGDEVTIKTSWERND